MAEKMSVVMARKSLERADVAILLIDAEEGATSLDATIGGYAQEAGVSVIIAVNKWDLIERDAFTAIRLEEEYRTRMKFLEYAPMVFLSAKTGLRVARLTEQITRAFEARKLRVPTAELNQFLGTEVEPNLMASRGSKSKFPLKYAAQVGISPPSFVVFVRGGEKLHFSTERFVINQLRAKYEFYATPIRIMQRFGEGRKIKR